MRRRVPLLAIVVVLVCSSAPNAGAATRPMTATQIETMCRQFFHDACSEAMGRWLPGNHFFSQWWYAGKATFITKYDSCVHRKHPVTDFKYLGFDGPADGTKFVYGEAGPPRGSVVYDRIHKIAFYRQGCCSWNEVVLAADAPPPPKVVEDRDLHAITSVRGIYLGMSPQQVRAIYGWAPLQAVPKTENVVALAYSTLPPPKSGKSNASSCGQMEDFLFQNNVLFLIRFVNAC